MRTIVPFILILYTIVACSAPKSSGVQGECCEYSSEMTLYLKRILNTMTQLHLVNVMISFSPYWKIISNIMIMLLLWMAFNNLTYHKVCLIVIGNYLEKGRCFKKHMLGSLFEIKLWKELFSSIKVLIFVLCFSLSEEELYWHN